MGNLEENSLPRILNYLSETKSSGTLAVVRDSVTKKLYMKGGGIIFASSTYEGDRLGELMLKAGKININQFDTASKVVIHTGKRMGGVMVELGYIKPKDLFWGVKYQVQEIVCSLFSWTEGRYEFLNGELPQTEVITLHMSTANLILHGIKRIDDWTRISRGIPSMESVLCVTSDPMKLYQDVSLSGEEKKIIALFDGTRSIKDVFDKASIGDFEALKAVYVLYTIGIIVPVGECGKAKQAAPGAPAGKPAKPDAGPPPPSKEDIHKAYSASRVQNYYELLGLDTEATTQAIEDAYQRLSRMYHPDLQFRPGMEQLRDELTELFGRVTEAHSILSDDSRRWEYDLSLATATSDGPAGAPSNKAKVAKDPAKAKEAYARGVESFKKKDFESATVHFKEASRLDATNASYLSYLALALLQRPRREAEAEEVMMEAVKLEPKNPDHHANLGLLYQKSGIRDKAKEAFTAALKLDPKNAKALKGLGMK